ncbi:MAG: hypothetical protein Q7T71_11715, partial [Herbiconiux sp.]|nr:hypothetical protein [Herbiconiux sp.]
MSDPLSLARRLSALDDDALSALLVTRQVAPKDLRDFFDLADALLDPASIRLALRPLDRATLATLADGGPVADPRAVALALTDPAADIPFTPYDGVPDVARTVLAATPPANDDPAPEPAATHPGAPEPSASEPDAATTAVARERAFVTLTAVSELLHQLHLAPVRVRTRGGVSAADEKRLAPLLGVEPESVALVAELARAARLADLDPAAAVELLLPTERAHEWLLLAPGERWLTLATDWIAALDPPVRSALGSDGTAWTAGPALRSTYDHLFPAADDGMRARLPHVDAVAETLGLHVDRRPTLFGALALATALPAPSRSAAPAHPETEAPAPTTTRPADAPTTTRTADAPTTTRSADAPTPAARIAASKDPGDRNVSPSSCAQPSAGTAS